MIRFVVIGITDNPRPWFPPEVMEIIKSGRVFSGGKRHHEIVARLLPSDAEWIDITVPLSNVFEQYRELSSMFNDQCSMFNDQCSMFNDQSLIVFASGDPLFFGFANTLRREFPDADIRLYPTFNSLQLLAHRLVMPYHDMRIVSLTGRPWPEFDRALIERAPKIGILTDREHTPAAIAQRMLDYGYTYYNIYIGEHLGHPEKESVTTLTLEEAATRTFDQPNCVILHSQFSILNSQFTFGIPDDQFALLDGRERMITKMPIRLLSLQALDLPRRHVLWDIGFCTGSISIEARRLFPHLHIEAFEIRPEGRELMETNSRRFGTPGISYHIGDFLEADLSELPAPDAVFIGGHGGHLQAIMAKVLTVLAPDGVVVMNSVKAPKVTTDSHQLWADACAALGLRQEKPMRIVLDDHHPIEILKCKR